MQRCQISESSLSSTARVKGRKLGNIWALKNYLDGDVSFEQRDHFPLPKYQEYLKDTYNIHEASDYNNYLETRYNWLQESVTKNTAELSKLRSCNMCLRLL